MSISPSSRKRKAWDLNPHNSRGVARFSKPARRAVSGYLPYLSVEPPGIEPATRVAELARIKARGGSPNKRCAELVSSCWTMSPSFRSGSDHRCAAVPGLEPTSRCATTCFQDRLLIRPDDFRPLNQAPGVGIEPTASWFRARRHYQQQLPRIVFVQRHAFSHAVR